MPTKKELEEWKARYSPVVKKAAEENALDPDFFDSVINTESAYNPNALSPRGAVGLAQIVPSQHPGVNVNDPIENVNYGAKYLTENLKRFGGDKALAAAAYNTGPTRVERLLRRHGQNWQEFVPDETKNYLEKLGLRGQPPQEAQPAQEVQQAVTPASRIKSYEELDDTDFKDAANKLTESLQARQAAMDEPRTVLGTLGDIGVAAAKSVVGTGEAAVGLADLATWGWAGKMLEKMGYKSKETQQTLSNMYSNAQKLANERVQDAQGLTGTVKAYLENPSTIPIQAVETLGVTGLGGAISKAAFNTGTKLASSAAGTLANLAGRALTAGKGAAAVGLGEGLVTSGALGEQIRQETDTGTLSTKQILQSLGGGAITGAIGYAGMRLANKLGFADPDAMLAGLGSKEKSGTVARRIVEGGVSEGLLEEFPQSAQEQIWQNAALDRPLFEGVPEAAVQGAMVGGFMGGAMNVIPSRRAAGAPETQEIDERQRVLNGIDYYMPKGATASESLNYLWKTRERADIKTLGLEDEVNKRIIDLVAANDRLPPTSLVEPPSRSGGTIENVQTQLSLGLEEEGRPDVTQQAADVVGGVPEGELVRQERQALGEPVQQVSGIEPVQETTGKQAQAPVVEAEEPQKVGIPSSTSASARSDVHFEKAFAERNIPKLEQRITDVHKMLWDSDSFEKSEFYDKSFPIPKKGGIIQARNTDLYEQDPAYRNKVDTAIQSITESIVDANKKRMILSGNPRAGVFGVDYSITPQPEKVKAGYTVNVARAWNMEAKSKYPYTNKLGNISIREGLQNSLDAVLESIQTRQIKKGNINITDETTGFIIEDNGIGMSDVDIAEKFLALHGTGKNVPGRFGGFGIAKAVILGPSETADWILETRDNYFTHELAQKSERVKVLPTPRQGTKITLKTQEDITNEDAKRYVETTEVPKNINLTFNGQKTQNPFNRKKAGREWTGNLGDKTTYTIKYYPNAPDGYNKKQIIRLIDHKTGAKLTQAIVNIYNDDFNGTLVQDIETTETPGNYNYPLTDSRMDLKWNGRQEVEKIVGEFAVNKASAAREGQEATVDMVVNRREWRRGIPKAEQDPDYQNLVSTINQIWDETGHFFGHSNATPFTPLRQMMLKKDKGYKGTLGGSVFHAKHVLAYEAVSRLMAQHANAKLGKFYLLLSKPINGSLVESEYNSGAGDLGLNFLTIDKTSLKSPLTYATYLKGLVDHELTHYFVGPHNEDFSSYRERVQRKTAELFPQVLKIAEAALGKKEKTLFTEPKVVVKKQVEKVPVEKLVEKYLDPQQLEFIFKNLEQESIDGQTELYLPESAERVRQLRLFGRGVDRGGLGRDSEERAHGDRGVTEQPYTQGPAENIQRSVELRREPTPRERREEARAEKREPRKGTDFGRDLSDISGKTVNDLLDKISERVPQFSTLAKQIKAGGESLFKGIKFVIDESDTPDAWYDSDTNEVGITRPVLEDRNDRELASVLIHEAVHGRLQNSIPEDLKDYSLTGQDYASRLDHYLQSTNTDPNVKELIRQYKAAVKAANVPTEILGAAENDAFAGPRFYPAEGEYWYGLSTVGEFASEIASNKAFQEYLQTVEYKDGKSLWDAFLDLLRKILGVSRRQSDLLESSMQTLSEMLGAEITETRGGAGRKRLINLGKKEAPKDLGRSLASEILRQDLRLPEDAGFVKGAPTVLEVAKYLEAQSLADKDGLGKMPVPKTTPEQDKVYENTLEDFYKATMESHPEAAKWDTDVNNMFDILSALEPSITTPENRFRLGLALAITSNGEIISNNMDLAYSVWKNYAAGKGLTMGEKGAAREKAMTRNLGLVESLKGKFPNDLAFRDWLLEHVTVDQMLTDLQNHFNISRAEATDLTYGSVELVNEVLPRAIIFGPKVGAWFANIMGDPDALTLDMWATRTHGRISGNLIDYPTAEALDKHRNRLKNALDKDSRLARRFGWTKTSTQEDLDNIATQISKMSSQPKEKGAEFRNSLKAYKNGDIARLASNALTPLLQEGTIVDAPKNGSQRKWIRDRWRSVANKLGVPLSKLQATVWIGEQEVYRGVGARGTKKPYYSDAARELLTKHGVSAGQPTRGAGAVRQGAGENLAKDRKEAEGARAAKKRAKQREIADYASPTVVYETLPSPDLNQEINKASEAVKKRYHEERVAFIKDKLAPIAKALEIDIGSVRPGRGGYKGEVALNSLATIISPKPETEFTPKQVGSLARALQYMLKQNAVPWFSLNPESMETPEGQQERLFKVKDSSGKVLETFKKQKDAETFSLAHPESTVSGGKYATGVAIKFDEDFDGQKAKNILSSLQTYLGEDVGFTELGQENTWIIVNFRDNKTGLPWVDDETFLDNVQRFVDDNDLDFGIISHERIYAEGDYGYDHQGKWQSDPEGKAIIDDRSSSGLLALQDRLRGWRDDLEKHHRGYTGEALKALEAEVSGGPSAIGQAGEVGRTGSPRTVGGVFVRKDGTVGLVHWSHKEGIQELDPAYHGTGIRGAESKRKVADPEHWVNRTYLGIEHGGYTREPSLGPYLYRTSVPFQSLYNIYSDPDKLVEQAKDIASKNPFVDWANVFEQLIKQSGYKGYWSSVSGGGQVAAIFDKLQVESSRIDKQPRRRLLAKQTPLRPIREAVDKAYSKVVDANPKVIGPAMDEAASIFNAVKEMKWRPGGFWDQLLRTIEWSDHPVAKEIFNATQDRELDKRTIFYENDHDTKTNKNTWEILRTLKNEGINLIRRVRSRDLYDRNNPNISEPYRLGWDAIDYMDTNRVPWEDMPKEQIGEPKFRETKNFWEAVVLDRNAFDDKGMDGADFKTFRQRNTARGDGVSFLVGKSKGQLRTHLIRFSKELFENTDAANAWISENRKRLSGEMSGYRRTLEEKNVPRETIEMVDAFRKSMDKALGYMRATLKEVIDAYKDAGKDMPIIFNYTDPTGRKTPYTLEDAYDEMGSHEGYYAPRIREAGDWVVVGIKDGVAYRYHTKSNRRAIRLERRLRREGFEDLAHFENEKSIPESVYEDLTIGEVAQALESSVENMKGDFSPEIKQKFRIEVVQAAADMLRARAFRSHRIARLKDKVVKGYIEDPLTRHILYQSQIAGGIAKGKAATKMMEAFLGKYEKFTRNDETGQWEFKDDKGTVIDTRDMTDKEKGSEAESKYFKRGGVDIGKEKALHGLLKDYITNQLRNPEAYERMVGLGKSIVSFKYLGFNPRSMMVNMTAMVQTVPPAIHQYALGGKGSISSIVRAVFRGMKDYQKVMRGKTLPNADEQAFMDKIQEHGYDSPQYMHDAMGSIHDLYGGMWSNIMQAAMKPFSLSEQWNRGSTMLAAYRLAREQGQSHEEAMKSAETASNKAHGIYGQATLPYWAQGKGPFAMLARTGYTYQKFAHNYLQMLADLGFQRQNFKALAFALAAPTILGGAKASLAVTAGMLFIKALLRAAGYDEDPEKFVYDTIREELGGYPEQIARYGTFGALGFDISSSMAVGMEVPRSVLDLAGPFGGLIEGLGQSWHYLDVGQPYRALEGLTPNVISNVLKGIREAQTGAVTKTGHLVLDENAEPYMPSAAETALKVAGFRGARRAAVQERQWEAKKLEQRFSDKRDNIYERYRAYIHGGMTDQDQLDTIMDQILKYNESVTDNDLSGIVPLISGQTLRRQLRRMTRPRKADILRAMGGEREEE